MNISAILVVVPRQRFAPAVETLSELPGVDVHHQDPTTGRIVVTQEAETVRAEVAGLERIQMLPDVILAEMVSHYFGDDSEILEGHIPTSTQVPGVVPALLRDGATISNPRADNGEE